MRDGAGQGGAVQGREGKCRAGRESVAQGRAGKRRTVQGRERKGREEQCRAGQQDSNTLQASTQPLCPLLNCRVEHAQAAT